MNIAISEITEQIPFKVNRVNLNQFEVSYIKPIENNENVTLKLRKEEIVLDPFHLNINGFNIPDGLNSELILRSVLTKSLSDSLIKIALNKLKVKDERISLIRKPKDFLGYCKHYFKKWFKPYKWSDQKISRMILSKILLLSNMIAIESRFGSANVVIVNPFIGQILRDSNSFQIFNDISINTNYNLSKIGKISNLNVFISNKLEKEEIILWRESNIENGGIQTFLHENIEIEEEEDNFKCSFKFKVHEFSNFKKFVKRAKISIY